MESHQSRDARRQRGAPDGPRRGTENQRSQDTPLRHTCGKEAEEPSEKKASTPREGPCTPAGRKRQPAQVLR